MRPPLLPVFVLIFTLAQGICARAAASEAETIRRIYAEALTRGTAYENLRELTTSHPGRLSGSKSLEGAVIWAKAKLEALPCDRVTLQAVSVPHWERGAKESVSLLPPRGTKGEAVSLAALALGGSEATPPNGLTAGVIEVQSLADMAALGREKIAGKVVFFNRPMDPTQIQTGVAYRAAGDQRNRGPAEAAKLGATAVLVRSLTLAHNDVPHTGTTAFEPGQTKLPCAALSTVAAERLSNALKADPTHQVQIAIHAKTHPDALSHNVVGEIRGGEFPDEIILVGGHLDSWDIAPGAHDDGAGIVQSMEVLRIFRALGLKPRRTLRCVLFTAEENSAAGAIEYARLVKERKEKHLLAVESDNGGFQPRGFNLGHVSMEAHERALRWRPLFEPYGIYFFQKGTGGVDVSPLLPQGATVAGLMPDSQRYFDYHHTADDTLETVNPRELHLGSAALAALIWLVDSQGL